LRLKKLGEPAPGSMKSQGGERLGAVQCNSELLSAQALPCHELHHLTVFGTQSSQGFPNGITEHQRVRDIRYQCVVGDGVGRQAVPKRPSPGVGPPLVRKDPSRHADQPGKNILGYFIEAPPSHEERARYDVVGVVSAGPGRHIGQDLADVAPVQKLKSRVIDLAHDLSPNALG
jgi:hypothetical protein